MTNLLLSGKEKALLAELHDGQALVAVAFGAYDGDSGAGKADMRGNALSGRVGFVEGAATATHFLVTIENGVAIVARDAKGLAITETPGLAVPSLSEVTFDNTPATRIE